MASLTGLRTLFSEIWRLKKQLIHVTNIILAIVNDDGDYDGGVGDDDYYDDSNYDYNQDYEC